MSHQAYSVVYQAAKLGDLPYLRQDLALALRLDAEGLPIGRIYGNSSGSLAALAHAIVLATRRHPGRFAPQAGLALAHFEAHFQRVAGRETRAVNWRGLQYGIYSLGPLRRWLAERMDAYAGRRDITLGELGFPVYLCVQDRDGFPVFFGPPQDGLQAVYHTCRTRIEDAPAVDACIAALSTMLSTDSAQVNGHYYKDGRPAYADITGMVVDMEDGDPRPVLSSTPYAPLPNWPGHALSQPFIMHRWHERNQADLTAYYNDMVGRHRALRDGLGGGEPAVQRLSPEGPLPLPVATGPGITRTASHAAVSSAGVQALPVVRHVDLPYIGSTEAGTNMRQNQANKDGLMVTFRELGRPQLEGFDFQQPFNLIYGAGGFSGMLAGLLMSRLVDDQHGNVRRIFGCSAGVLNGLFHAVALAARRSPEQYQADAQDALSHLEQFFEALKPEGLYRLNRTPRALARALANLGPLREQLVRYLELWTGRADGASITFQDMRLPFYAAGARGSDGYLDLFGMPDGREMTFFGRTMRPVNCPIVDAVVAGWAQPFYITPPTISGETYFDGGSAFYDIGLFAAAMDAEPISLLNIHVCEPPNHSYGFPERLNLLRIIFDTHNFTLPEERRRMRRVVDLFFEHERLRRGGAAVGAGTDPAVDAGPEEERS